MPEPDLAAAVALLDPVDRGWSAGDVAPAELVDDDWIRANTRPGRAPSKLRHAAQRAGLAARTLGRDPYEGADRYARAMSGDPVAKLPRALRRTLIQSGGLTREQMRRIAARTGYPVVEAWSGHNKGAMRGVWGAMVHHTGTAWSAAGDYPTLRIVRDGRAGLLNSLCAFGLGKSGTAYLINERISWHAGAGAWNGMTDGNGYTVGIEAESDGRNWTAEQRDAYPRLVASILIEIGQDDRFTTRHASYALPKGRKVDASGLDMDAFWSQVYAYLARPETIHRDYGKTPAPTPPPPAGTSTHTVVRGDTLYGIARRYSVTVADLRGWNQLTTDTITPGQVLRVAAVVTPTPASPPPPPPAPVIPRFTDPAPTWPSRLRMPATHYFGDINGPSRSHGGWAAWEKAYVRWIQRKLIALGFVPGVTDWRSGWADGVWGPATTTAMAAYQRRWLPRTTVFGVCYAEDYRLLVAARP